MSLIIETLGRLKGKGRDKPIPPGLKRKNAKGTGKKRFFVYFGVIVILAGILSLLIINKDKLLYGEKGNILSSTNSSQTKEKQSLKIAQNPVSKNSTIEKKPPIEMKSEQEVLHSLPPVEDKIEKKEVGEIKNTRGHGFENRQKQDRLYLYNSYLNIANNYLDKGLYTQSLEYYKKAYNLKKNQKVLKNIILLQILIGNTGDLNRYISQLDKKSYIADIAIILIKSGQLKKAEKYLSGLTGEPSPYLLYAYGILREKQGKYQQAQAYYKKAYQLNPYDQYITYAYARILEINGFSKKAADVYIRLLSLENVDTKIKRIATKRLKMLR